MENFLWNLAVKEFKKLVFIVIKDQGGCSFEHGNTDMETVILGNVVILLRLVMVCQPALKSWLSG